MAIRLDLIKSKNKELIILSMLSYLIPSLGEVGGGRADYSRIYGRTFNERDMICVNIIHITIPTLSGSIIMKF